MHKGEVHIAKYKSGNTRRKIQIGKTTRNNTDHTIQFGKYKSENTFWKNSIWKVHLRTYKSEHTHPITQLGTCKSKI